MREIKFRAWDLQDNRMLDFYQLEPVIQLDFNEDWTLYELLENVTIMNNRLLVMQFTGLKDKNGREIYEGDIIKMPGFINKKKTIHPKSFVIKYECCGYFGMAINGGGGFHLSHLSIATQNYEVIGNIYEHPEMLGIKKMICPIPKTPLSDYDIIEKELQDIHAFLKKRGYVFRTKHNLLFHKVRKGQASEKSLKEMEKIHKEEGKKINERIIILIKRQELIIHKRYKK